MSTLSYPTLERRFESSIRFFFISAGPEAIVKAIEYRYIGDFQGIRIFNLAFGDYDTLEDKINDAANSNNGDVYRVFNTVLNTIPKFFANFEGEMMMVQGSDSGTAFLENCKLNCTKNCAESERCKNQDRRITIYRKYVDTNYDPLTNEYTFYDGFNDNGFINIEAYQKDKKYDSVFVSKNNNKFVI